jgi:hypothetical protein
VFYRAAFHSGSLSSNVLPSNTYFKETQDKTKPRRNGAEAGGVRVRVIGWGYWLGSLVSVGLGLGLGLGLGVRV